LHALAELMTPPQIVIVRATPGDLPRWQARLNRGFDPHRLAFCIPDNADGLTGLLASRAPAATAVAYVCEGTRCRAPVTTLADLDLALTSN
jgi:uncharacterized protein YyaL (SSP411 family)